MSKIKLPEKLKIAAFDIIVEEWGNGHANDSNAFGDFKTTNLTIRVDCSINKYKIMDTLLHEINHAIWWAYGLEDEDKQERVCGTLATAYIALYRDNPHLIEFIKKTLDE